MRVGDPVSITFEDGETVEGWLYGELPQGHLISLDPVGKEIRFIPKIWQGMGHRGRATGRDVPAG